MLCVPFHQIVREHVYADVDDFTKNQRNVHLTLIHDKNDAKIMKISQIHGQI